MFDGDQARFRRRPEDDAPRRSTVAAAWQLRVKTVAGLCPRALQSHFRTSCSRLCPGHFAQGSRGAAPAYGEAIYPGLVDVGEPVDQRDPVRGTQSEHGNPNQLQSRTSGLSEISPIANDGIRGRAARFWYHVRLSPAQLLLLRPNTSSDRRRTRAAAAEWSTSIAVVSCEPSIENPPRAANSRLAIAEPAGFRRSGAKRYRNFPQRHRTPCGPWRSLRMTRSWSPASCRRHHLEITFCARAGGAGRFRARAPAAAVDMPGTATSAGERSGCASSRFRAFGARKPLADQEPITPIPPPPAAEPRKLALWRASVR